jgi:hypothetical protein
MAGGKPMSDPGCHFAGASDENYEVIQFFIQTSQFRIFPNSLSNRF